ncbi:MAG: DUF4405 domain-containing protein [archaeon]
MNKTKINFLIDVLLGISFIVVAITSIILFFKLAPKYTILQLHNISGMIFILLSLIHIGLHFNWFLCVTKSFFTSNKQECKK